MIGIFVELATIVKPAALMDVAKRQFDDDAILRTLVGLAEKKAA